MPNFSDLNPQQMAKLASVAPNLVPQGATVGTDKYSSTADTYTWGGGSNNNVVNTPPPVNQSLDVEALMQSIMQLLQPQLDAINQSNTQFSEWLKTQEANKAAAAQEAANTSAYNTSQQGNTGLYGSNNNIGIGVGGENSYANRDESGARIRTNEDSVAAARSRYMGSDVFRDKYGQ